MLFTILLIDGGTCSKAESSVSSAAIKALELSNSESEKSEFSYFTENSSINILKQSGCKWKIMFDVS